MKKHSHKEIALKLTQANELARAGNSQVEISKALGVSIMTLHRWRKLPLGNDEAKSSNRGGAATNAPTDLPSMDEMRRVLEELTFENQRLRKLVTDLMLEKMRLEDASPPAFRVGQVRKA
ncbi:transposase-like protein [Bradyrhizobium sp. CIR18]|uniref:helix-turn-helix domain-containing protein n=1 Tax=Bradyrhizobium sp. CIR18 TaxID=2663839 RepID=UPI001606A180|nr:helix-turn-helix domain-containing protein [Bradyrhizobium sp. CIR18]MBB4366799.1 transposase-like protein [Bradyrhizobium sp. CIR18]